MEPCSGETEGIDLKRAWRAGRRKLLENVSTVQCAARESVHLSSDSPTHFRLTSHWNRLSLDFAAEGTIK